MIKLILILFFIGVMMPTALWTLDSDFDISGAAVDGNPRLVKNNNVFLDLWDDIFGNAVDSHWANQNSDPWRLSNTEAGSYSESGGTLQITSTGTDKFKALKSSLGVAGDFDVSIGCSLSGSGVWHIINFMLQQDSNNYACMFVHSNGRVYAETRVGGAPPNTWSAVQSGITGLRITRVFGGVNFYYRTNGSWVHVAGIVVALPLNLDYVIGAWAAGTGVTATGIWDNLVASGTCDYWDDSPEAVLIEKDAGYSAVWDMSTANWVAVGTGTPKVQYSAHDVPGVPIYNGVWLTLAQLQAEMDPTSRYFQLKIQFNSDSTQDLTVDDVSIDYASAIAPTGNIRSIFQRPGRRRRVRT